MAGDRLSWHKGQHELIRSQKMPFNDYLPIVPWVTTVVAVVYALAVTCKCAKGSKGGNTVNKCVQKDCEKVIHTLDIEDLGDKAVLCRCWKSSKFPYCDGTHNKHNQEFGDNVGPVIVKKKDA